MRQAGCLIPLFSIRTRTGWGLGEIPDLVPFARWASAAGFSVVQLLPVHEASRGQSSPYRALSLSCRSFLDQEWRRRTARAQQLEEYTRQHAAWLEDYTLFTALHDDR